MQACNKLLIKPAPKIDKKKKGGDMVRRYAESYRYRSNISLKDGEMVFCYNMVFARYVDCRILHSFRKKIE